jgi:hypothetical protein
MAFLPRSTCDKGRQFRHPAGVNVITLKLNAGDFSLQTSAIVNWDANGATADI